MSAGGQINEAFLNL